MSLDIKNIKRLMLKKCINNRELAKKMNVTPGRVSNILNARSKTCRIGTICSLAKALDVEVEEIYKED